MKIKIALLEYLKGYKKIWSRLYFGYIVFETSHLSEYGIVATEKYLTQI